MDAISEPIRVQGNAKAKHVRAEPRANGRLGKQVKKVTQDVSRLGRIARDVAEETLGHLGESASETRDQGRDKVQEVERTIEQFIRERPLKTVLIAAGVGLLLGRFWMRR